MNKNINDEDIKTNITNTKTDKTNGRNDQVERRNTKHLRKYDLKNSPTQQ